MRATGEPAGQRVQKNRQQDTGESEQDDLSGDPEQEEQENGRGDDRRGADNFPPERVEAGHKVGSGICSVSAERVWGRSCTPVRGRVRKRRSTRCCDRPTTASAAKAVPIRPPRQNMPVPCFTAA